MRKNVRATNHTNRRMNNETYALRRKVIDIIYALKKAVDLPRIDVRITDHVDSDVAGSARLNDNIIWICANTIQDHPESLYQVVAHEVVHTVTGFRHDEACDLMCAVVRKTLTTTETNRLFKKYF